MTSAMNRYLSPTKILVLLAMLVTVQFVHAAEASYPSRPVRVIVPATPGAGTDAVARMLGPKLNEAWGVPVVIDNRPGAAGTLGAALVAQAPADGHTLVMGAIGSHGAAQGLRKNLPYDPIRDFAPIVLVGRAPSALLMASALPANNVNELVALARAKPGELNYGSGADGTPAHLASEMFLRMAGIKMLRVPYKGPAQALVAVVGGEVRMAIQGLLTATPFVQSGRVRLLATTGSRRAKELPDVPTIAESIPGYEFYVWYGVLAPAGTPRAIVNKLNTELVRIVALPEIEGRLRKMDAEIATGTPEEFSAFLKREVARWNKVIAESGLKAE